MGISFLISLNNPLLKNMPHVGSFLHLTIWCICVFCICIFVFARLTPGIIIFDTLEQSSFQKYATRWVFLALCHMLYLCICIFVYLYFCICAFDTWEYHFWYPWTIPFSKICHMLGLSGTSQYAVYVYLCILLLYLSFSLYLSSPYDRRDHPLYGNISNEVSDMILGCWGGCL